MSTSLTLDGETLTLPTARDTSWDRSLNATVTALNTRLGNTPKFINVKKYGAVGDGTTDDTAAIQAAINAAPARVYGWSSTTNRPQNASVIYFPTGTASGAGYRVTQRIDIPATKNICLMGDSSHSARIFMDNVSENYIFRVVAGDGQRPTIFEKLILHKGGIEYESGARRFHAIRDCVFSNAPEWAVRTLGISVIDVRIEDCQFTECVGGINIAYEQSDVWRISHCSFIRNSGVDLKIQTSGVHVEHCDFEVKQTNATNPFVQICNDSGAVRPGNDVIFHGCRFGNEANPPRDCVVIGPLDSVSTSSTGSIWFDKCLWRGANGQTPSSTQGKNAFLLNQAPSKLRVTNCEFFTYTNIFDEGFQTSTAASALAGPNHFYGPMPTPNTAMFTGGGIGWTVDVINANHEPSYGVYKTGYSAPTRGGHNLLPRTGVAMPNTSWLASNATLNQDVTGPDGVANSAYRILRTAGGSSASVRAVTSSADSITGAVTFSVWLKQASGGFTRARLGIIDSGNIWRSKLLDVYVTADWARHEVTAYGLSAQTITCQLYVGSASDTTVNDEICFAFPAAHKGPNALPEITNNADSGTAIHAPAQWQGLVLGHRTIGYGSAAPAAGRYEVGDIVFDIAPTSGGNIGWVCTAAGAPGTWKTWGVIA